MEPTQNFPNTPPTKNETPGGSEFSNIPLISAGLSLASYLLPIPED